MEEFYRNCFHIFPDINFKMFRGQTLLTETSDSIFCEKYNRINRHFEQKIADKMATFAFREEFKFTHFYILFSAQNDYSSIQKSFFFYEKFSPLTETLRSKSHPYVIHIYQKLSTISHNLRINPNKLLIFRRCLEPNYIPEYECHLEE